MTEHEEVRVVFDQDLDKLESKVKLIRDHVKGLQEEFEEVRISCKSFSQAKRLWVVCYVQYVIIE
jgi:chaperonin cofactor prefoldin